MSETPSSESSGGKPREATVDLEAWINSIQYAAEGICAQTGLPVQADYKKGIITPAVDAEALTAAQRAEIQKWKDGLPHLTINFHR